MGNIGLVLVRIVLWATSTIVSPRGFVAEGVGRLAMRLFSAFILQLVYSLRFHTQLVGDMFALRGAATSMSQLLLLRRCFFRRGSKGPAPAVWAVVQELQTSNARLATVARGPFRIHICCTQVFKYQEFSAAYVGTVQACHAPQPRTGAGLSE